MNTKYPYAIIAFIVILASLASCSATRQHTLSAMEPASVDLATTITKIGIINESSTSPKSAYNTRIEQLLSAKDHQLEQDGIDAAISGLFDELLKDQRFDTVKMIRTKLNNGKGLGATAQNISWNTIKDICEEHGVDAIFSLAYYEADTQVSMKKKAVKEQNMLRQYIKVQGHEITLETLIENGWRIYEPYSQKVIDEIVFNDQITSTGTGTNPMDALYDINDRREAVLEQSKHSGSSYGSRLVPQEKEVVRAYYVRGSNKLVEAKEWAASGDWQKAAALWEQEADNDNAKIKAKACYNMAFYNEMNEKYQAAMEWAEKASENDSSKNFLAYKEALQKRVANSKIVLEQLERSNLSAFNGL
ncbi:MAG: hypothetical protein HKP42_13330 [Maribacter sp.]|nr:hypothetical protein [Maribacter sp.]